MTNKTFVIIKPDAIERGLVGEIISRFEHKGFCIYRIARKRKNREWCHQHYDEVFRKYPHLVSEMMPFMVDASLIGIILLGQHAIETVRQMVGATDSLRAYPGTIRGDYGNHPVHCNLVHAADSLEAVNREISLFFNKETDL